MIASILYILDAAAITVCLFSAFLLFVRAEGIRARKVLGGTLLAWGVIYLIGLIRIGEIGVISERGFIPVFGVISGTMGGCSLMFYMVEVMRSGWLSWKRILFILSPYFLSILGFAGVQALSSLPLRHLEGVADFMDHIEEFNVWYRLVFLFITIWYMIAMFTIYARYAPRYRKWIEENCSSTERMDNGHSSATTNGKDGCAMKIDSGRDKAFLPNHLHSLTLNRALPRTSPSYHVVTLHRN